MHMHMHGSSARLSSAQLNSTGLSILFSYQPGPYRPGQPVCCRHRGQRRVIIIAGCGQR